MTNEEYDKMFQISKKSLAETQQTPKDVQNSEEVALKKLNLRTLKGAFIVLLMGFALSTIAFILERLRWDCDALCKALSFCFRKVKVFSRGVGNGVKVVVRKLINVLMFKFQWE